MVAASAQEWIGVYSSSVLARGGLVTSKRVAFRHGFIGAQCPDTPLPTLEL